MRVAVVGVGAVGRRVVRSLAADPAVESVTVHDRDLRRVDDVVGNGRSKVARRRPGPGDALPVDVTIICTASGVRRVASAALDGGSHVISAVDDPTDVRHLLRLDSRARALGLVVAVGTAMAPGLSCVLAAQLRNRFDKVEEIHVASLGTGGPACARRHHAALSSVSVDWEYGDWRRRPGGSGRELVWFPEPVGGADCYRAGLADALLLAPAFPGCRRITSRLEATRRDRLTSWLPMMRRPHPEGLVGAIRVEMRGWIDGRAETEILGSSSPPAVAAAAVTAVAARWAATGRMATSGAAGLAGLVGRPGPFLRDLADEGLTVSEFQGAA